MKIIKSSKYREHKNILCLEIRKLNVDKYQIKIYVDAQCQQYVGQIEVAEYYIDAEHSKINLFGFNDLTLGTLKYRTIFDMEN